MNPQFPVYIISKNRWKRRPTANLFERLHIPYYIIVEDAEYEEYKSRVQGKVLILPKKYQNEYDTFWEDADPRTGPGAARNFAWDHSIANGFKFHWVFDDNIESIYRFNNNLKIKCTSGTPLYIMGEFVLRYKNIAQAGPNYQNSCPANEGRPPITFNTRIYSALLIRNDIPYRWRGRYNEDTDLSLRALKDGWCTVQFNAFLQDKRATQTVSGGNSSEFYDDEGTYKKSKMLQDMHPDCARISKRFHRWHHYVNYKPFKMQNKLVRCDDYSATKGINNFGLVIRKQEK